MYRGGRVVVAGGGQGSGQGGGVGSGFNLGEGGGTGGNVGYEPANADTPLFQILKSKMKRCRLCGSARYCRRKRH